MCRPSHKNANNQATKHVEIPQTQYIDKVAVSPIAMQSQVPLSTINQATKHVETLQQYFDKVALLPVAMQRQAPRCQVRRSRNKLWKSPRPFCRGSSRSVWSYRLTMCQCLRPWKRLSGW